MHLLYSVSAPRRAAREVPRGVKLGCLPDFSLSPRDDARKLSRPPQQPQATQTRDTTSPGPMRITAHPLLFCCLVALAGSQTALAAQDALGSAAREAAAGVDDGTSIFGEPLYVNGKRISDLAIKRYLCYGKGSNGLAARKLQILIDAEKDYRRQTYAQDLLEELFPGKLEDELSGEEQKQIEAAVEEQMKRFEVNRSDYEFYLKKENSAFMRRYPTLDLDVEIIRAYNTVKWYEDQLWQTLEFDQLFFPDHTDTWPEISIESIRAGSPNVDLVEDYARNYDIRLNEDRGAGEPIRREDEMMMQLLRDYLMKALESQVEVLTAWDGIPERVLLRIKGDGWEKEIHTEDVYQEMKSAFNENEVRLAKEFLALTAAAEDKLGSMGLLKPADEFNDYWNEIVSSTQNTIFNMSFMVLSGHMFPSQEAYYRHLWLMTSYRQLLEPELEKTEDGLLPAGLQEHLPVANGIMGLARARAEILLVSAFDFPNNVWKENGWASAEREAMIVREEVDAYLAKLEREFEVRAQAVTDGTPYTPNAELQSFDEFWSNVLDLHSEYWDPPMPAEGKMPPAQGFKNKGRFNGELTTRNDLKRAMGESSFWHFISGSSIVDTIFFDLEPRTVGGPYFGPHGFYIVYLKSRSSPTNPLNWRGMERHFDMLKEDFVSTRFTEFCHHALIEADVTGL